MKYIVTAVSLFLITGTAVGQISLDESTLQGLIGKRIISVEHEPSDTTGVYAITQQTGENETWDITGFGWAVTDTATLDFLGSIAGTVGENDPDFAAANLAQISSVSSDTSNFDNAFYSTYNSSGLFNIGTMAIGDFDSDMMPDTSKSLYVPAELDIPFPFTYQTMVSDSVAHEAYDGSVLFARDTTAKSGVVDGWGTLVTPDGNFDVLRYSYEERTYLLGFVFVDTHYEWWGQTGPLFSVSIEQGFIGPDTYDMFYNTQTITDITSIDSPEVETPSTFALQQNYPNPFNPTTTIPFELTEPGNVKLAVYDLLGREVDVLISAQLPVGVHEATWNPVNLPGGLYVARLEVDGVRQSRTMTLLK